MWYFVIYLFLLDITDVWNITFERALSKSASLF